MSNTTTTLPPVISSLIPSPSRSVVPIPSPSVRPTPVPGSDNGANPDTPNPEPPVPSSFPTVTASPTSVALATSDAGLPMGLIIGLVVTGCVVLLALVGIIILRTTRQNKSQIKRQRFSDLSGLNELSRDPVIAVANPWRPHSGHWADEHVVPGQ